MGIEEESVKLEFLSSSGNLVTKLMDYTKENTSSQGVTCGKTT